MVTTNKHVKAVIQLRRATEQEWIDYNPILRVGEPALSTDKNSLKVGNGKDHWLDLPYLFQDDIDKLIKIGDGLIQDPVTGVISVDSTNEPTKDSEKLITSGGVYEKLNSIDYEKLTNKPQIETIELRGNKTFDDLGLVPIDADDLIGILI